MLELCRLCKNEQTDGIRQVCHLCLRREEQRVEKQNKRSVCGRLELNEWLEVLSEYNYSCKACKSSSEPFLTLDHVIPMSKGGANKKTNIVPLCSKCHEIKGTIETKLKGNKKKRQEGKELKELYQELF